jgi:hypothetical protein
MGRSGEGSDCAGDYAASMSESDLIAVGVAHAQFIKTPENEILRASMIRWMRRARTDGHTDEEIAAAAGWSGGPTLKAEDVERMLAD